jgi:hypothetical protein
MSNPGNTGHRYRMQKFAKVEPCQHESGQPSVRVTLACGHSYIVRGSDPRWFEGLVEQGKKTRCLDCPR